jgi:ABC-type transporter Mla subunit MlaD
MDNMSYANNTAADFAQAATEWQKMWMDSWSQLTKNTIASESFATASSAYLDWTLAQMSGQVMETLDMPRRSDLARLAAQVQSVESRLLDQQESHDELRDLLTTLHAKLDRLSATPGGNADEQSVSSKGKRKAS